MAASTRGEGGGGGWGKKSILVSLHVRESRFLEIFACGIRNPGLWNPKYSYRCPESHY